MAAITGDGGAGAATTPAAAAGAATPAATTTETPTDWRAGLTGEYEGLRTSKALEPVKGADWNEAGPALAKMYDALSSKLGQRTDGMVRIPGKDAKPDEIAAFNEARGVPKTPAEYKLEPTHGGKLDEARFAKAAPAFHKMGFTNDQVQQLAEWAWQEEQDRKAAQAEQYLTALDGLAEKWGETVFNRRSQLVQRLVNKFASPDTVKFLDQSGLANHPGLFEMLWPIAHEFAEDGLIDGAIGGTAPTPEALDAEINTARDALTKLERGSPEYVNALKKYEDLLKARYPEPVTR